MGKVRSYLPYILVILLTFFAVMALFHSGFFPFHDNEQVARLYDLNQDVHAGHLPPRFAQDLGYGYDYPLFNFYPSFVYYVAEIFKLVGFSYIASIKLMIGTGFILSAIFMYLFTKDFFGKVGGILAAVAYTYAPYHSVDVYVRGALPEFWSFVFLPAIFWSLWKIQQKAKARYVILGGIFFACFILTHNLIAMMSSIFIALFGLYLLINAKNKKQFFSFALVSFLIGVLLSAYFWLPAITENKYTMVKLLTTELASYNLHFVCPMQFWNAPWGYGGSAPGCIDGMSYQLGKFQIVLVGLSLLSFVILLKKKRKNALVIGLFFILFLLSLFMQVPFSKWIWDHLPPFWYIQFPWRFLVFSAFTASFLSAAWIPLVSNKYFRGVIALLFIAIIIGINAKHFVPSMYLSNVTDSDYTNQTTLRWDISQLSFEYTPNGIATKKSLLGNTVIDITKDQIATSTYKIISGTMRVEPEEDKPQKKQWQVAVQKTGVLQLNIYSFPGWEVFMDGKKIHVMDNNKLKLLRVLVPSGTHTITAIFTDTLPRMLGNILSLLGIVLILIIGIMMRQKKYEKNS